MIRGDNKGIDLNGKKILLMVLPFLTPICPPVGISCLKRYLEKHGCHVKTADAMSDFDVRKLCYLYFETLKAFIPENKRGHFFNIGLDVLSNHFMAHINYTDENKYMELIKDVVYKNYYINIDSSMVRELNTIVDDFYSNLRKYLMKLVKDEEPELVGVSTYRGTLAASFFALKLIKEKFPWITTVMGGTIFSQELFVDTPNFELFLEKADFIDKILIGEGEKLFLSFIKGLLPKEKKVLTLKDINDELLDLNTLEIPDYSDFDIGSYPLLPSYTSRGCVYRCSFCAETVFWKKYRKKNTAKVVDEFQELSRQYGTNVFLLTDCLINPVITDLAHELTERDLNFYWDVYLKVDKHVGSQECVMAWRKGGFYRARLGIESGSQKVLDIIDKKITISEIKKAISNLASAGIKTTTYWIAGHPGETEEDFQQTLDLIEELQDDIYEAEADPFRYFYNGQVNAEIWDRENGNTLLYPDEAKDMLLTQSWTLNTDPLREVVYERACRFREHCKKCGIPNPYSVSEIYSADKRWKTLHKNAVPTLMELRSNKGEAEENKKVLQILKAEKLKIDDVGFNF